ncbi:MAG: MFS transporter [Solirubrobacterales bacterium]
MGILGDRRVRRLFLAVGGEYGAEALLVVLLTLTALDGGPAAVTAVLVAQGVPRAALLPFGGMVSDRFGAARVAPLTAVLRAAILLALAVAVIVSGVISTLPLALAGAVLGTIDAISYPASMALVPAVAPRDSLAQVNTAITGVESVGGLVGPVAAAGLYAAVGSGGGLAVVAALALLSAAGFLLVLRSGVPAEEPSEISPRAFFDGIRFAWRDEEIRRPLVGLAAAGLLLVGPVMVGGAVMAEERFGDRALLGYVLGGFGVGSLLGLALAPRLAARSAPPVPSAAGIFLGLGLVGVSFAPGVAWAAAAAGLMGVVVGATWVAFVTWIQKRTPGAMRGRMMSIVAFAFLALDPLSYAVAGVLLPLGFQAAMLIPGALLALVAVVSWPRRSRARVA